VGCLTIHSENVHTRGWGNLLRILRKLERLINCLPWAPLVRTALVAFVLIWLLWPASALATDCNSEQSIFVRALTTDANGTLNVIEMHDRDLNSDCYGAGGLTWSTAHMTSAFATRQAEVGYVESWGAGQSHIFQAFWEAQIGNMVYGGFNTGPVLGCCADVAFKVVSVPGTNDWKYYLDYGNNGGWNQIGPANGHTAGFDQGVPEGETSRAGGTATGAYDHQHGLQKKQGETGSYTFWGGNVLDNQYTNNTPISNWHYHSLGVHEYEVIKD
jgi:hypothetical protein